MHGRYEPGSMNLTITSFTGTVEFTTLAPSALCPDLLRYEQIGQADGWRGRVVRAFFWCLRVWPC